MAFTESWLKCCLVRLNVTLSPRSVTYEILNGDPKLSILEKAASWPADLIVLGSRAQGLVGKIWPGGISASVVRGARCSVEVLPARKSR